MTQTALRQFYTEKQQELDRALTICNRRIRRVSNGRLATALGFLAVTWFGLDHPDLFYALIPLGALFVLLVRVHARLFERKVYWQHLRDIQAEELRCLDGVTSHNDAGAEFVDPHHPYTHDLDIFGPGSLFQYINRCSTQGGRSKLATRLRQKPKDAGIVRDWQQSIRALQPLTEFRQHVQALSRAIPEEPNEKQQLEAWLGKPPFLIGRNFYRIVLHVFPPITVALVSGAIFTDGLTGFAVAAAGIQWAFLSFHLKRVNAFHAYISGKKNTLARYADSLKSLRTLSVTTPPLLRLRESAAGGYESVRQLATLVSAFDARMNSMTNLVVNSLLLYDLQCVYRLERWKESHGARLFQWIEAVHEAEVLCSIATFAFNHPQFSYGEVAEEGTLHAQQFGHPLLREEERVANDFQMDMDQSVAIVTGANMAGKSTFLRSIGVNVVLAMTGAPVCAQRFRCPLIAVRSGMRTADSLQDHQSYFYAELDRLRSIMDELRAGTPLLILLDEILKGTNSNDKQAGSIALVRQLVEQPCLAVIATHDLALGQLESEYPGRVRNYAFEPVIEDDQLSFSYKLQHGIAKTMNATFLMRKMGILPRGD